MEALPPGSPESGDKKESASKKKKSAEVIGAFIVEPKVDAEPQKNESIFARLTGIEDKPKAPEEEAQSQSTVTEINDTVPEHEAPLESLSEEEKYYVEAEIVTESRNEELQSADTESIEVSEAVELFRDKIVNGGADSEQAFQETLAEMPIEEPSGAETAAEPAPQEVEEEVISLRERQSEKPVNTESNANLAGTISTPRRSAERQNIEEEPQYGGTIIAGGTVGYLMGRRRGRIKTEKKLLPVQKTLEKEVIKIKKDIAGKEAIIREVAVKRVSEGLPTPIREKNQTEKKVTRPEFISKSVDVPMEHIGKVVINAETKIDKKPEVVERLNESEIYTLSRAELLAVSEKINIEGSSLRQIYENRLVGEKGLRRLIAEYLRNGNMRKALKRELLEREIDFERDPILRDKDRGASLGGGTDSLTELLQKAGANSSSDTFESSVLKARAAHEKAIQKKQAQKRRIADVSLAVIIAVLLSAIITVLLTR